MLPWELWPKSRQNAVSQADPLLILLLSPLGTMSRKQVQVAILTELLTSVAWNNWITGFIVRMINLQDEIQNPNQVHRKCQEESSELQPCLQTGPYLHLTLLLKPQAYKLIWYTVVNSVSPSSLLVRTRHTQFNMIYEFHETVLVHTTPFSYFTYH